jgi:hypothetical protein
MQLSVSTDFVNAFPGMDGDLGADDYNISRVISTQQLEAVVVGSNANGTFAINIDSVQEASFVASSNSVTQIAAGLLASWTGNTNSVTSEASGTDTLLLESTDEWDDDGFTCTVTETGNSNTDITTSTLVAQGQTVQPGIGVCTDDRAATSGQQCRLPRQATDITARFLGVTRADTSMEASAAAIYQNRYPVSIKRKGRIWVRVQDAVAEMGDVYCRYSTAVTGYGLGSFRSDDDSSTAAQVPNAKYLTSAAAGGLALVELS